MNPLIAQHWDRVEAWLDALLDLAPAERAAWLAAHCDDDALRLATLELAAAEDEGERALAGLRGEISTPIEGARIGPYTLLRLLGEGGMATVFLAERTTAEFKQRVALKLMRTGLFSPSALERFRREQQIHATLEHPNIARIHDSGISSAGVPYFAVEYVDGTSIDAHCDQRRLGVDARLALFVEVCDAVAFAHQNLVVHRDLKPSNILVTADGTPKLLDFGIAKLIAADAEETRTATDHRHLTPAYAAPEQFEGGAITTATDAYALGVLLAQLLTGQRPAQPDERESTTRRVASRIAMQSTPEHAALRNTTLTELRRRLRGDLDWIIARALAPDPARRYTGAAALRDDIRRHLDGLPVQARPDTMRYRAAKFARRHVAALAASLLVAAALVAATAISLTQAGRAQREAARATSEAQRANAVKSFLLKLFVAIEPGESAPPETADAVLERGGAQALEEFAAQPELEFEVLSAIGEVESKRGELERARAPLERALAIAQARYGRTDPRTLTAATHVARLDDGAGRFDAGAERLATLLGEYRRAHPGERSVVLAEALIQDGSLATRRGKYDEAVAATGEAIALARAVPGADDTLRSGLLVHADALMRASRIEDAFVAQREAFDLTLKTYGPDHVSTALAHGVLAEILRSRGRLDEAEKHARESVAIYRRVFTGPSPDLATALNDLAVALALQGKVSEAVTLLEETLSMQREVYDPGHAYIASTIVNLGAMAARVGEYARAEQLLREAREAQRAALGADHPRLSRTEVELGRTLLRQGRHDEAAPLLEAALAADLARFAEPHVAIAADRLALADLELGRGRVETGLDQAKRAHDAYEVLVEPTQPKAIEARYVYGRALAADGQHDAGATEVDGALAAARTATAPQPFMIARTLLEAARLARGRGDAEAAQRYLDDMAVALDTSPDPEVRLRAELARERKR